MVAQNFSLQRAVVVKQASSLQRAMVVKNFSSEATLQGVLLLLMFLNTTYILVQQICDIIVGLMIDALKCGTDLEQV